MAEPVRELADLVERLVRAVRSEPTPEWMDLDLTVPQVRVLLLLEEGALRMGDIAQALGVRLPSVTHLVDRLVERGLVERFGVPQDRRLVLCRLTAEGRSLMERLWRANRRRVEEIASVLDPAELEKVLEGLRLLLEAVGRRERRRLRPQPTPAAEA